MIYKDLFTSLYNLPVLYDELTPLQKREVRTQYINQQNNLCYYCKCSLSKEPPYNVRIKKIDLSLFPPNFLKHPIHLQHCHDSGLTEGAVHAYCNAVLWQYHGK